MSYMPGSWPGAAEADPDIDNTATMTDAEGVIGRLMKGYRELHIQPLPLLSADRTQNQLSNLESPPMMSAQPVPEHTSELSTSVKTDKSWTEIVADGHVQASVSASYSPNTLLEQLSIEHRLSKSSSQSPTRDPVSPVSSNYDLELEEQRAVLYASFNSLMAKLHPRIDTNVSTMDELYEELQEAFSSIIGEIPVSDEHESSDDGMQSMHEKLAEMRIDYDSSHGSQSHRWLLARFLGDATPKYELVPAELDVDEDIELGERGVKKLRAVHQQRAEQAMAYLQHQVFPINVDRVAEKVKSLIAFKVEDFELEAWQEIELAAMALAEARQNLNAAFDACLSVLGHTKEPLAGETSDE